MIHFSEKAFMSTSLHFFIARSLSPESRLISTHISVRALEETTKSSHCADGCAFVCVMISTISQFFNSVSSVASFLFIRAQTVWYPTSE